MITLGHPRPVTGWFTTTTKMERMAATSLMLRVASLPGLSAEEWQEIRIAPTYMDDILANMRKHLYNPLGSLTGTQKKALLAYLVFSSENAMTREDQGHTLLIDSVRTLLSKETDPYSGKEKELDYDLATALNKLHGRGESPLPSKVGIDEQGTPYTAE